MATDSDPRFQALRAALTTRAWWQRHHPRFLALVDATRSRVRETDVATIARRLENGEALTLVDVREESEWAKGHLPGACHVSKGLIERDAETHFPDLDAELVLYCGGGYRSVLAADALRQMGYANAVSMDGGYLSWIRDGHPIEGAQ
jgi:rhodanese-related sulfurtransferase